MIVYGPGDRYPAVFRTKYPYRFIAMALDANSYCPGATGKKIKFCCGDFLDELQKIDRMMEGEQYQACLQRIERLRQRPEHCDRQCLLVYQAELLRVTGQREAAARHVAAFLEKYPENQAALAEAAVHDVAAGDSASAMGRLQKALASAQGTLAWQVCEAAQNLAEILLVQGRWVPGRALLAFLLSLNHKDEMAGQMFVECLRSEAVPLVMKEDSKIDPPPPEAPWRDRFESALAPLRYGAWQVSADRLAALAEEFPDVPVLWQMLGRLRGWLGDDAGCIAALRKFAALPVPPEEAVEAEARALFLQLPALGDPQDLLLARWTVGDAELVNEALLSNHRFRLVPFDSAAVARDDSPPPKAMYQVLDRPPVVSIDGLVLSDIPCFLGQLVLFGKQTDREARLELLGSTRENYAAVQSLLESLVGQWLAGPPEEEVLQTVSCSIAHLRPRWDLPEEVTVRQQQQWEGEYLHDFLLNRWPEMPLGCLDGQAPQAAAADPARKNRLLAAVLVLEHYVQRMHFRFDFNELRDRLGLPRVEAIDPEQTPLEAVPICRLARLLPEKLPDAELSRAFQRAQQFRDRVATLRMGEEILRRESFERKTERIAAYAALAREEFDPEQAEVYLEEGKRAAAAAGQSTAAFDLQELQLRIARREGTEILRLIERIHTHHGNEPGILDALMQILMQAGILLPDGRMAIPVSQQEMAQMSAASGGPADPQAAEPGRLWTPEGAAPAAGGAKLWTPE